MLERSFSSTASLFVKIVVDFNFDLSNPLVTKYDKSKQSDCFLFTGKKCMFTLNSRLLLFQSLLKF